MQTTLYPTKTPDAARLALRIIKWNYGELCEQVVETLIKRGRSTFQDLRHLSKIPAEALRTALIVLIQQNAVAVYFNRTELDVRNEQLYEADVRRIIHLLRHPRFIEHIKTKFADQTEWGPAAILIVKTLLHHGKLRLDQIPHAVQSMREPDDPEITPQALKSAVKALIQHRFIERVPPSTLPPPVPRVPAIKTTKKKAVPKPGSEEEAQVQREADREKARQDYQNIRFNLDNLASLDTFTLPVAEADAEDNNQEETTPQKPGSKRSASAMESSAAAGSNKRGRQVAVKHEDGTVAEHSQGAILWRVNYDEFNRIFRNQEILQVIGHLYENMPYAVQVIDAMLSVAATRESHGNYEYGFTGGASVEETLREGKRLFPGGAPGRKDVVDVLEGLDISKLIEYEDSNGSYRFQLKNILDNGYKSHLLAVIEKRHGPTARRVWNMLLIEGQMEQKPAAERAMAPNAEVREALYALQTDGYLTTQEIPKSNDRAPSKTCFTWRATMGAAVSRMSIQLYRSAANVLARLESEGQKNKKVIDMVQMVNRGEMEESQLNLPAVNRLQHICRSLETALVRLDEEMLLFCDSVS